MEVELKTEFAQETVLIPKFYRYIFPITKDNKSESNKLNRECDINDNDVKERFDVQALNKYGTDFQFRRKIVWFNTIGFLILHIAAVWGIYLLFTKANVLTFFWMIFLIMAAGQGITTGAHRFWSHRAFKVKPVIKTILLILQTVAGQNCLWTWVRDHRQHHRYADTDADPHNATRGFFFSHIGWLMSRKHPLVIKMGKNINMGDLEADLLVMLQKKYYKTLYTVFSVIIPILLPSMIWKEGLITSLFISFILRTVLLLHITWSVNSIAHLYGTKPYKKNILAVDSFSVSMITNGEGWHNYHHVYPWDYKAAEFGRPFQGTTHIIELLSKYGLIYDLKEAHLKNK